MTPDFTERAVWSGKQWSRAKTEVKWSESQSVVSSSLRLHGLYSLWNSPGQKTGVGSLSLPQRIFPSQGLSPGLQHCRWILYQLSHQGCLGRGSHINDGMAYLGNPTKHLQAARNKNELCKVSGYKEQAGPATWFVAAHCKMETQDLLLRHC